MKLHSKNDTQTIKDHSTSVDIKTIQNYLSSTGTKKQEIPTQKDVPLLEWEAGNIRR